MSKKNNINSFGLLVWSISILFYLYEFILQVSPGVLLKPLMAEFSLTAIAASQIGAVYFFTYAFMQIPAGTLLDKFGPRKILSLAALICTIGTFLMSFANSFSMILLARFLTAIGSATAMIGSMKIVSNWFDEKYFAVFVGLISSVGMFGVIFAKAPLAYAVENFGWQSTVFYLGVFGIIVTFLVMLIIRNEPIQLNQKTDKSNTQAAFRFADLKAILKSSQTWLVAIYGGLILAPVLSLGTLWGEKYLIDSYNYTNVESAATMTFMFIGFGIGAPLGGWISDYLNRRKIIMLLSPLLSFIFLLAYIYVSTYSQLYYCILGFLLGGSTALSWTVFAYVKEIFPKKQHATALACVNLVNMLLCATGQMLIGLVLALFFEPQIINGISSYTELNYEIAFVVFPIFTFIAFILACFLKEKNQIEGRL